MVVVDKAGGVGHGSTSASSAVVRCNFSTHAGVATAWESRFCWRHWVDHLGCDVGDLARFERSGLAMLDVDLAPRAGYVRLFDEAGHEDAVAFGYLLRTCWRSLLVLLCYFGVTGVVTHMFLGYMPTYLGQAAGISSSAALTIITALTLFAAAAGPVFGVVADRIGRRPLVCAGALGSVVLPVPAYLLIGTRSMAAVVVAMSVLLLVVTLLGTGGMAVLEMLPADVRYSGVALPYNMAYAVFAGTAPLVSQLLVDVSGSLLAPAFYATALALLGLPVILRGIPETRGIDLRTGVVTS